jgi:hypothetical protein
MAVGYPTWNTYRLVGKRIYRDHYETRIGAEGDRTLGGGVVANGAGAAS